MISPAAGELRRLLTDLQGPGVWIEIGVLAACLLLAYGVARWLARRVAASLQGATQAEGQDEQPNRRAQQAQGVWFGRRVLDGLMFPLLSLVLVYLAQELLVSLDMQSALLRVALPILMSLSLIRLVARVLAGVFPGSGLAHLVEQAVSWLAWIAVVLWMLGFLPAVLAELDTLRIPFGKTPISVRTLVEGLLSCSVVLVLTLWLSSAIETRVLDNAVRDLSMRKAAVNAVRALLLSVGLLIALSAVGVDLTALSVLGGALGVGLGFGLQKLAANYVSGFVILLERSLRIGDMVRVDTFEGRITDIKTRYTLIRALNGVESVVPNELMIGQRTENLSLQDSNIIVSSTIVVGLDSDVDQVRSILCQAASAQERVLKDPAPAALLSQFAPDGLEFTLLFWIADPHNGTLGIRSDVHIAVLNALRAAKIDLPYPQRVLHYATTDGRRPSAPALSENSTADKNA